MGKNAKLLCWQELCKIDPFKDHINVEAMAIALHREALLGYKMTPKGMLQIFVNQRIPSEALMQAFRATLTSLA